MIPGDATVDVSALDESWINDRSEFQRNWVHGLRNPVGLHLEYHLERDLLAGTHRVVTEWIGGDDHVGFPGFIHGGLISAVLDDAMGRSTALLKRWVVTGRLEVRYRQGTPVAVPLRVEGWMAKQTRRVVHCAGRLLLPDGTVVAEATGTYLPLTARLQQEMLRAWPGFAKYLDAAGNG